MASSTVLVLGGGVGGLVTASKLRKRLAREHRVVLVDREERHYFAPSFPWVMVGWREPHSTHRQLSTLSKKGIEFIQAEVRGIDVEARTIRTDAEDLSWDYLVIALGTEMSYDGVPGLSENSHTFYTLDGAVKLRGELARFGGGKVAVAVAGTPYRCPAAPYEGTLLIDHSFRKRGVRDGVDMEFFTPEPAPLPVAGPDIGSAVTTLLQRRDIGLSFGAKLTAVDGEAGEMGFEDGARRSFDLLVTIPQHRASAVVRESGLTGDSGWIEVDRHTLATARPNVYALGDVSYIELASGLPLPKAGVFAHGQAEVVADNIASVIAGDDGSARFNGHGS